MSEVKPQAKPASASSNMQPAEHSSVVYPAAPGFRTGLSQEDINWMKQIGADWRDCL